jgi:hypothetical protein
MTLVALFAMTTGAWAEEKSETISTNTSQVEYTGEHFKITPNIQKDFLQVADLRYYDSGQVYFSVQTLDGQNISKLDLQISYIDDTSIDNLSLSSGTKSYDGNKGVLTITNVNADHVQISLTEEDEFGFIVISSVTYYYEESAAGPTVEWDATTKTGTFVMPAFDVEIAPIYAPAAQWAKDKELDQIPTAIEGIYAGTTDAIVKAGTVAKMGMTENVQGIVMYAVTSSNQATAPALTAFSATVPTAENIADEGADVLIWYYIQGADTPQGEEATAENTFNDSEICAEPIKVTVLPNKYDIQFNAANANTIEAGKATVKVGDAAATVTEGKLQGVKMDSKVTINAKQGYKFRKVEVKKAAAAPEYADKLTVATYFQSQWNCTQFGTYDFIGQVLTDEQAIALAKYQAAQTGKKCAVFYKKESWLLYFAKSDGTIGSGDHTFGKDGLGLSDYDTYYVAK